MSGAFGLAGWHFSSNPTSSSSENKIGRAEGTEPWKTGRDAAYQYHPHGDPTKPRKDAPSALNEVIIPNVNLPKVSLSKESKWPMGLQRIESEAGKPGSGNMKNELLTQECSLFTRSTTSGARRASKSLKYGRAERVNIKESRWPNRANFFCSLTVLDPKSAGCASQITKVQICCTSFLEKHQSAEAAIGYSSRPGNK